MGGNLATTGSCRWSKEITGFGPEFLEFKKRCVDFLVLTEGKCNCPMAKEFKSRGLKAFRFGQV